MNLRSFFLSSNLYISIAANLVILIISSVLRYIGSGGQFGSSDVCTEFDTEFYFTMIPKIVVLISSFPVITSFCADWNTQYIRSVVGRTGIKRYLRHKVLFCIFGTFISAFISLWLFTFYLQTKMPMITPSGAENLSRVHPFGELAAASPYIFQFLKITCFSIYCSFWSVVGLAVSAYIPNRFVVFVMPFVIYYISENIFNNKAVEALPTFLHIPYLGLAAVTHPLFGNPVIDIMYILALFLALSFWVGGIFIKGAKRRINNEIV